VQSVERFDLLVIDIRIPGNGGLELVERIKALPGSIGNIKPLFTCTPVGASPHPARVPLRHRVPSPSLGEVFESTMFQPSMQSGKTRFPSDVVWVALYPIHPRRKNMSCHPRVTEWATILHTRLPSLTKPQATVLALWSLGMGLGR